METNIGRKMAACAIALSACLVLSGTETHAAVLPVQSPGFDDDNTPWLTGTSGGTIAVYNDARSLSLPNLLGASNFGTPQSRLQRIASDYTSEATIALSHEQYEADSVYTFQVHSFAGDFANVGPASFKLQLLANPVAGGGASGNTIAAEQLFLADNTGSISSPNGTLWDDFQLSFDTASNPSVVGQYINIQIITTQNGDLGHDGGFPNFDNVSLSVVPEPTSVALLAMAGVLLLRRRRHLAHGA